MTDIAVHPDVATRRDAIIAGLRELADWLEAHPDVELPLIPPEISVFVHEEEDNAGHAAVKRLAAAIGAAAVDDRLNSLRAQVTFSGGVAYEVIYIKRQFRREHDALHSYEGLVQPEGGEAR